MEMSLGIGLFAVGIVLFVLAMVIPQNGRSWIAQAMRSEYSALIVTVFFGFGMALAVDGALSVGPGLAIGTVITLIGFLSIAVGRASSRSRALL